MRILLSTLVVCTLLIPTPSIAQGCSQCSQAVGQTPARTQAAYRRAILLLVFAGGAVFTAGIVILRRHREVDPAEQGCKDAAGPGSDRS